MCSSDLTCEDCLMIAEGTHPDVYELDAASRTGVDNVREEIISRVHFAPTRGRYKIYIIDEVHMLSTAAFNALLKTLEEPPDHVVFVLATTDPQKVPETIHSRCQRFDFHSIPTTDIISRLSAICSEEDVDYEPEALEVVAHQAQGGMRNALTGLEQLIAFSEGKVTLSLAEAMFGGITASDLSSIVQAVGQRNAAECFRWVAEYANSGADLATLATELAARIRNLYVLKIGGADVALDVSQRQQEQMREEVQLFSVDRLARLLGVLGELIIELKTSTNARLSLEIALTRMVRPESDLTLEALAERIARLEAGGIGLSAPAPMAAQVPAAPVAAAQGAPLAPSAQAGSVPGAAPIQQAAVPSAPATQSGSPMPRVSTPSGAPSFAGTETPSPLPPKPQASSPTGVPAPTTAVGAAIPAGFNLENPAALQRIWQSACSILRQSQSPSSVFFLNTKVSYDAATQAIVILFSAQNDFVFKQAQKPEVQQSVAAALQQAYGQPVQFRFEKLQEAASVPTAPAAPASAPPRPAPVAQQASYGAPQTQGAPQGDQYGSQPLGNSAAAVPPAMPPAVPATSQGSQAQAVPSASSAPHGVSTAPNVPNAAPLSAADVPPWEEVPYGEEDFYPCAGDAASDVAFNGSSAKAPATSSPASVPPAPPAPPSAPHPASPATPPAPPAPPTPSGGVPQPAAEGATSLDELQSILAAGFGDGVVVESIDNNA